MGLTIRFQGGPDAGKVLHFDDDVELVALGRDPDKCQVVFPADQSTVGREHCALKRVLGRYRLQTNKDNLVLIDDKAAIDDQELGAAAELQLGPDGPILVVETESNPALAATMAQGRRAGKATMLLDAGRSAKRGRNVAVAAILLLVVATGVGYLAWRQSRTADEEAEKKAKKLGGKVTDVQAQLASLAKKTREDLGLTKDKLAATLERLRKETKKEISLTRQQLESRKEAASLMPDVIAKATPSVYRVMRRKGDGSEEGVATAWVVRDGILATNSHVADVFNKLEAGDVFFVRSNEAKPKDFTIGKVKMHPGYNEFMKLWNAVRPMQGAGSLSAKLVQSPGSGCDVALLYLKDPKAKGLAKPLPMADNEDLYTMRRGDLVCFVGYPMEGVIARSLKFPNPQCQVGFLTTVSDYFGVNLRDEKGRSQGHLVQHALPASGGASGSPILNADGRVVAVLSGGNVIGLTGKGRISSAAGINFGQRVDLVKELFSEDLAKIQAARSERWKKMIGIIYKSGTEAIVQRVLKGLVNTWETKILRGRSKAEEMFKADRSSAKPVPGKKLEQFDVALPAAGKYLVVAVAPDGTDIDMAVAKVNGNQISAIARDMSGDSYPACAFDVDAATSVRIFIAGPEKDTKYELHVYRAK